MLIVVHGLWSNLFVVDGITIFILFILSIPYLAFFLRKAKIPGAEFEFKDEIDKTKNLVEKSLEKTKEENQKKDRETLYFETFNTESSRELIDSDPVLALAALRIEIEKKIRIASDILDLSINDRRSVFRQIETFHRRELLSSEQVKALQKILYMCNRAIHGSSISKDEAKKIIDVTDQLNKSFAVGYSINFAENPNYKKHGLLCKWEHCIEWMPLSKNQTELSCKVFGHNCPGGIKEVKKCNKKISDIPKDRFIKS